jgi:uncharacterized protein YecT (DUF1311 family)
MKCSMMAWLAASALAICGSATASSPPAPASTAASAGSDKCMDNATSQASMNECASNNYGAADKELNQVYQQVLAKYASDKVFIAKLRAAQKAWLAYRDAELEAMFPASDKSLEYGSVYPMCANNALEGMTRKRIEELRTWLKGTEEGDVCAGSYQVNPHQ